MDISREFAVNVAKTHFNDLDEITVSRARRPSPASY
jgi:hypothetical protein